MEIGLDVEGYVITECLLLPRSLCIDKIRKIVRKGLAPADSTYFRSQLSLKVKRPFCGGLLTVTKWKNYYRMRNLGVAGTRILNLTNGGKIKIAVLSFS